MAGVKYKQDLPPPGGYADIYWKRTTPKTWFTAARGFGLYAAGSFVCWLTLRSLRKQIRRGTLEENDVNFAITPFVMAERDRRVLRMHRHLRDLEAEVMKDVPGWKVGTWYGEPKYFTVDQDDWWDIQSVELLAHSEPHRWRHTIGIWNRDDPCANKSYSKYMPEWYHKWGAGAERPYQGELFGAGVM